MENDILTSPFALLVCLLSLPLLVAASIASIPGGPWAPAARPLRVASAVAVCLAIAVVAARFLVVWS